MINTDIYGLPENWTNAQYMPHAKYVNFGTAASPKNTLLEGSTAGKTPTGKLIENSICTQALGKESLYSNVLWVHDYGGGKQYVTDEKSFVPYFYAECVSADNNGQNNTSTVNIAYNTNSWSPYNVDEYYQNKSAFSKPIVEYQPKKIIYRIFMTVATAEGVERPDPILLDRAHLTTEQEVLAQYPFIANAYLRVYVDSSSTDTPQRTEINSNSLFGVCPNVAYNAETPEINIDYALMRSCAYNHIPIYGVFTGYNTFDDYTVALCDPSNIYIDDNNTVHALHLWDDNFKEFLIRQAACFGGFVYIAGDSGISVLNIPLDNNDVICGVLDENGIGHGEYTRGAANRTNDIWKWQTNRDSPYDPYKVPDPTRYDTTTVFGSSGLLNTFVQYYALSGAGLTGLCDNIYSYVNSVDTSTEDINKAIAKTFYTNNPLDVIISLKRFPFNITQYSNITAQAQPVKLGNLSIFSVTGYKLNGQYTVVDFGNYDCFPYFGNTFLDYAPYTYYELIIPFCGSTRLDPAVFMGHKLRLKMVVDLYTGACTCYILADNLCIDSVSGNCAIDIPITGIQSADFQNSVQNAITNVKNARINTAAYNMRGNLAMSPVWTGQIGGNALFKGGAAARIGNTIAGLSTSLSSVLHFGSNAASAQKEEAENYIANQKAEYDLQHVQTPFASVGSQSAANSYVEEMQARLIIYKPKFAADYNESVYAATEGHACLINGKVSDFTNKGLTIGNVKTNSIVNAAGMSPTAAEQAMLKNAFSTGVIL